jgi:hypothetical protein
VLAEDDEVTSRLPAERIRQIRDEVWQESQARARSAAEALARLPGLQHPGNLAALTDEEILGFDGAFIPGGHGSLVDFADNADIGRVLRLMHGAGKRPAWWPGGTIAHRNERMLARRPSDRVTL